jgi:hypothetical protein
MPRGIPNKKKIVTEMLEAGMVPSADSDAFVVMPPPPPPCTHIHAKFPWLTLKRAIQVRDTCLLCGYVRSWIDKEQGDAGGFEWAAPWDVNLRQMGRFCREFNFHRQMTIRGSQYENISKTMQNAMTGADLSGLNLIDFGDRALIHDEKPTKSYRDALAPDVEHRRNGRRRVSAWLARL